MTINIVEKVDLPQARKPKDATEEMALRLYNECYVGHLSWETWLRLARFVLLRVNEAKMIAEPVEDEPDIVYAEYGGEA